MEAEATIRNFCIIAHVDHGKTTLADRLLELTHTISAREFRDQMLDGMDLERERGITIKCHPVTMQYRSTNGVRYALNLIDTPGHVDFSYEVSRSMAACEGALLVVDAVQGVEAQTIAHTHLAIRRGLTIIPVINKIDLPNANPDIVRRQMEDILAIEADEALCVSAKTGAGVRDLLDAIVTRIPPPMSSLHMPLRALIFDSLYDSFKGVIMYVRIMEGTLKPGERVRLMSNGVETNIKEVGVFCPLPRPVDILTAGQVGYVAGTLRDPHHVRIGDTITSANNPAEIPLPGFREVRPIVFAGFYPVDNTEYERLHQSLKKLHLNDSSFSYHRENSVALGFGFRCGFMGLLHLEIVQERLHREFGVSVVSTLPHVVYRLHGKDGAVRAIDNPGLFPDPSHVAFIEEPMIRAFIICESAQINDVMTLVKERRGALDNTEALDTRRVLLTCTLPLNEILVDFHDQLKSVSHGLASMDYEPAGYRRSDIVKLDILMNHEPVDAFSCLIHRSRAATRGREICQILRDVVPRHQFPIPVQAAIHQTIIARETIKALRKDVTAKLYGGDVTRKQKLLQRQKEGKKRMKEFGRVRVPQEAFLAVLRAN